MKKILAGFGIAVMAACGSGQPPPPAWVTVCTPHKDAATCNKTKKGDVQCIWKTYGKDSGPDAPGSCMQA